MPVDYEALTFAGMERMHPGSPWDIVCSVQAPDLPVCQAYASLDMAQAALRAAGFKPSAIGVNMAHTGPYDFTTAMRMENPEGRGIVLIRRVGS